MNMRPKDRVLAAIHHQDGDRVPVDYAATPEINERLLHYFHVRDYAAVLERLGVDVRVVAPAYVGLDRGQGPKGCALDMWGVGYSWVDYGGGRYLEATYLPFAEFRTVDDVERYEWPSPEGYNYGVLRDQCRQFAHYALVVGAPSVMDLINGTARGRGVEQVLLDIALEDPVGLACMEKRHRFYVEWMTRCLDVAGDLIDIVFVGDDYGSQRAQLISRESFCKLFKPKVRQFADLARSFGKPLMLHSCGSNCLIMPDLIDAGVSIYDTVQPEAEGMDPRELKTAFGDKMTWHGTISTQQTLPFGMRADVEREARERIEIVGKGGGLILGPAHNIQPDTPIENILALYRTAGSLRE